MPSEADDKLKIPTTAAPPESAMKSDGAGSVRASANRAVGARAPADGPATAGTGLLVVRSEDEMGELPPEELDTRLDRLPMRLDVMVKVHSFRVQDLLSMEKGTIVETVHEHTQDLPVCCGASLLAWAEFEVLDQRLAVRMTRLA